MYTSVFTYNIIYGTCLIVWAATDAICEQLNVGKPNAGIYTFLLWYLNNFWIFSPFLLLIWLN